MIVTTISNTINPTEKAVLPLATWASFGKKGAPAAVDSNIRPMVSDSSNEKTMVIR